MKKLLLVASVLFLLNSDVVAQHLNVVTAK